MRESGVRQINPFIAKLWHQLHSAKRGEAVDVEEGEGPRRASCNCCGVSRIRAPHSAISSTLKAMPSVPPPPDDILPGSVHDVPLRVRIERLEEQLAALHGGGGGGFSVIFRAF
jgi:hypothetical protein